MGKEQLKVDLTLVKKLLEELETSLNAANEIQEAKANVHDYIVEMAKAQGLAAGIAQESAMLILDIKNLTNSLTQSPGKSSELLEKLLALGKGSGGTN